MENVKMENTTIFEEALKNYVENKKNDRCYYMDSSYINYITLFNFLFTDSILCNNIVKIDSEFYYNEEIKENEDDDEYLEYYQYYLVNVDEWRLEKYKEYLQEKNKKSNISLFYSELLDCYVVGISHFGTSWRCVCTDVVIDGGGEDEE